jgi:hypothetical protein
MPEYDAPSFRSRRTPEPVGDVPADQDPGTFRPRDYSPEGRRSASPSWAPQYGGAAGDAAPAAAAAAPAPVAPTAPQADVVPSALDTDESLEHTLTRRELRALRDTHGITAETTGETVYPTPEPAEAPAEAAAQAPAAPAAAPVQDVAPSAPGTPLAAPSSRLDFALAEFDQLAAGRPAAVPSDPPAARGRRAAAGAEVDAAPVAETPVPEAAPVAAPAAAQPIAEALSAPPAAPAAPAPVSGPAQIAPEELSQPTSAPPTPARPEVVVAEIVEQAVEPVLAPGAVAEGTRERVVEATIVEASVPEEPSTATPPTGHWSTQAQLDDETQFGDAQLARNIGSTSGAITTSALVLPSIPNHEFGPLSTGDVMVTGSISLPASLSATGAHPAQLDESDLDHLLDPGDHQVANTDSQPVRAIKAVSTHTSSRGVIQTVKPRGTKGLTALIIAATGMAVLVGALFIVLVVTGQLG